MSLNVTNRLKVEWWLGWFMKKYVLCDMGKCILNIMFSDRQAISILLPKHKSSMMLQHFEQVE